MRLAKEGGLGIHHVSDRIRVISDPLMAKLDARLKSSSKMLRNTRLVAHMLARWSDNHKEPNL